MVRMKDASHGRHVHHHYIRYPVTAGERFWAIFFGPLIVIALVYFFFHFFPSLSATETGESLSLDTILLAALCTCLRLFAAYVLAVIVAAPLALAVTANSKLESVLLPVFDVLESVPILALFPVIILAFIQFDFLNGAAIFILFLTMLWNLVFTLIGGLKLIPKDITFASQIFGLRGFSQLRRVILPSLVPQFVTGSILAVAQGWNLIIVAEVLHTYIPHGSAQDDLFGIGSILVSAAANAQNDVFLACVVTMVIIIALLNFFVWQRLLSYSQRFRFE
jgi:NitT/TauT family transport system permease protein